MANIDDLAQEELSGAAEAVVPSVSVDEVPKKKIDFGFIMAETGEGEIEDYLTHPMNFLGSKGLAQIIRGVTGIVGKSLRLAVLDIVFGAMRFMAERKTKGGVPNAGSQQNVFPRPYTGVQ